MNFPFLTPSDSSEEMISIPPDNLVEVIYPEDDWYKENTDPICHQRKLRLTRGIHIMKEWWDLQHLDLYFDLATHVHYHLNGFQDLEEYVRKLHKTLAPHQKIEDRILIFGTGATQILNAAFYALSLYHSICAHPNHEAKQVPISFLYVTHQTPGYIETKSVIETNHASRIAWLDFNIYKNNFPENLIELVTTPNNPDGRLLTPQTKAKYFIYDRVNHWELFMHDEFENYKTETLENDEISIFSLSKFLSFSSSRVGYGFVKNPQIAHYMKFYIINSTHGYVAEGQLRCLAALHYLFKKNLLETYIQWTREKLRSRWSELMTALAGTSIKLQNSQGPCAWIHVPINASHYLNQKYHVECTYGSEYGASLEYARINMLCKSNEFAEFIWRLKNL